MRPLAIHRLQQFAIPARERAFERVLEPEPRGQQQPGLCPGKLPGNGTQSFESVAGLPARRTTADVDLRELGLRRRRPEVIEEFRIVVDEAAIAGAGVVRETFHTLAPRLARR